MAAVLVFHSREQWLALKKTVLGLVTGWILVPSLVLCLCPGTSEPSIHII